MEIQFVVVVALLAAAGGAVLGILLRSVWASQSMKAAAAEGRRIEAEARARQKELILEAKDEKLRMQREAEEEARARRAELASLESRLLAQASTRERQLLDAYLIAIGSRRTPIAAVGQVAQIPGGARPGPTRSSGPPCTRGA